MQLSDYYFDPEYVFSKKKPENANALLHWVHDCLRATTPNRLVPALIRELQKTPKSADEKRSREQAEFLFPYTTSLGAFQEGGSLSYVFQKDFFKKLMESDIQTSIYDALPRNWAVYMALPPGFAGQSWGLYVRILDASGKRISESGEMHQQEHPTLALFGICPEGTAVVNIPLTPDFTIDKITCEGPLGAENLQRLATAAVLGALYIHTANPDIRHLKPRSSLTKSAETGLRNKGVDIEATYSEGLSFPVELVSWNWDKDPLYQTAHWEVRAHFRHYWVGSGDKQRRELRWVAPFTANRRPLPGQILPNPQNQNL